MLSARATASCPAAGSNRASVTSSGHVATNAEAQSINVNVDAEVGLGSGDLCPPLEAAGSHVELDLASWERVAVRAPPRREVVRIGEGPESQLSGCVENA
jgi:hypothetical protein